MRRSCGLHEESGYSVLSRVGFPCGCRLCRGLHFSWNEVTKQEGKQTQYKCLSSSLARIDSWEEKPEPLLQLCTSSQNAAALTLRRRGFSGNKRLWGAASLQPTKAGHPWVIEALGFMTPMLNLFSGCIYKQVKNGQVWLYLALSVLTFS